MMGLKQPLTWRLCFVWTIAAIALSSCSSQAVSQKQLPLTNRVAQLKTVTLDKTKIVAGQTVYVPAYSYIYHYNSQNHVINLATTLSLRNTDLTKPLIIAAVRYYDSNGQLVRTYLEKPVELKPLASTDFLLKPMMFLVAWVRTLSSNGLLKQFYTIL